MKTVVYITKKRIWVGDRVFDWNGVSMDEVFGRVKKEMKVNGVRVVFGHDVSFVTAIKANDVFLTRESVLKLAINLMPFEIDSECFDWKSVTLGYDEVWIQIVALEKELLYSLISAVKKHGIKTDLITTVGVLLGEKTRDREAPVIVKWFGKESLSVLAINGLVDLVVSDIKEDDLMIYAKQKWGLAINPEEIILKEDEFNLAKKVFSEKTKGEDRLILNIPILKGIISEGKLEEVFVSKNEEPEKEKEVKKHSWWLTLLKSLVVILIVSILVFTYVVAISTGKRFADARDGRRFSDIDAILTAVREYIADKGEAPSGITPIEQQLGSATTGCDTINCTNPPAASVCLDLSTQLAPYLKKIPVDPKTGTAAVTGYKVAIDVNGLVTVSACASESGVVSISR